MAWDVLSPSTCVKSSRWPNCVTLIDRTVSASEWPCDTKTSAGRSFAPISSGLDFF